MDQYWSGDVSVSEPYLKAAWELAQYPMIGEHLAEVYEKLGKPQKAAAVCNMAIAALGRNNSYKPLTAQMEHLRQYLRPSQVSEGR